MVEIRIERKRKPIWPWLLLLLLLALIGWAVYELVMKRDETEEDEVSGVLMPIPSNDNHKLVYFSCA